MKLIEMLPKIYLLQVFYMLFRPRLTFEGVLKVFLNNAGLIKCPHSSITLSSLIQFHGVE